MRTKTGSWMLAATVLAFGGVTASAQVAPGLRTGTTELGLFAGASIGLDKLRPMGGMNVSRAVTSWALPYGEFSYFPEIARRQTVGTSVSEGGAKIYDIHFGVHLCAPLKEKRVLPYGVFGFGWVRTDVMVKTRDTRAPAGTGTDNHFTDNDPAVNFGGGIRYYATDRAGFRVEYKLYRPVSGRFTEFFSKVEGGLFFQF
jgi:hypothetical protein